MDQLDIERDYPCPPNPFPPRYAGPILDCAARRATVGIQSRQDGGCGGMAPMLHWRSSLLLVLLHADAIAARGYHVDFQSFGELIGVKNRLQGIEGLEEGFTVGSWLKYRDLSKGRFQMEVNIAHQRDDNFLNGFGGAGRTAWLFSGGLPDTFSEHMAPEEFLQWHHYAFTFESATGSAKMYIDGAKVTEFTKEYNYATTWADLNPSITLGTMCYHAPDGVPRFCFLQSRMFNGLMDDFSFFVGAQSEAEIAQKWNASMAERIAAGLEPKCARAPAALRPARPRLAPSPPLPRALPAPARADAVSALGARRQARSLLRLQRPALHAGGDPQPGHGRPGLQRAGRQDRRRDGHGRRPERRGHRGAHAGPGVRRRRRHPQQAGGAGGAARGLRVARHRRRPGGARPARRRNVRRARRPQRDRGARARRHDGARAAAARTRSARREAPTHLGGRRQPGGDLPAARAAAHVEPRHAPRRHPPADARQALRAAAAGGPAADGASDGGGAHRRRRRSRVLGAVRARRAGASRANAQTAGCRLSSDLRVMVILCA